MKSMPSVLAPSIAAVALLSACGVVKNHCPVSRGDHVAPRADISKAGKVVAIERHGGWSIDCKIAVVYPNGDIDEFAENWRYVRRVLPVEEVES